MERINFNLSDYTPAPQMTLEDIKKQMYHMPFELIQKEAELAASRDKNLEFMKLAPNVYINQLQNMILPDSMSDEEMADIRNFEKNSYEKINNMSSGWDSEKSPSELDSLVRDYSKFIAEKITPKVEARNLHNEWLNAYDKEIKTLSPELASFVVRRNISKANSEKTLPDVERAMAEDVVYGSPQWNTILSNDNLKSAIAKSTISEYKGDILNTKEAGYIDDLETVLGRSNFSRAACNVINGILASNAEIRGWVAQWCEMNGTPEWIDNLGSCLSLDANGNLKINQKLPEEVKQQALKAYESLTAYSINTKKLTKTDNSNRTRTPQGQWPTSTGSTPVTSPKVVHMAINNSWGDLSRSFNNGDWSSRKIIQQAGQEALRNANKNFTFSLEDVDMMLSNDFAELLGFYSEQSEEDIANHVPRGYNIQSFEDAMRATYNDDFYFTTKDGKCYVSKKEVNEKGEEIMVNYYRLHGTPEYYGFEDGNMYSTNTVYNQMAHTDFACALYAMTQALGSSTMNDVAVSYFDMVTINGSLSAGDKNAVKSLVTSQNFSLIYSTEDDGYSETADKFPNGEQLSGINIENIVSVGIGTRLSELVLECEDSKGNRFLCALKDDIDKKDVVYNGLKNIITKFFDDTTYQYMFDTPDAIRSMTYINRQPLQILNDGRKIQQVYLDREGVIKSGFDNVPISMAGCTIFKVFDANGNSYYDIRTDKDITKGSSILGDLKINDDYDLCSYMRTFNVLFNEVSGSYDNQQSVSMARRWLFGISDDEISGIKDNATKKWASAYGKEKNKALTNIMNDSKETTRDRIIAGMLLGKNDTAEIDKKVRYSQLQEGCCYFKQDDNGNWWQHILFRKDGGNGWAECVINYSAENTSEAIGSFYIQEFNMNYTEKTTTDFYRTSFIK